MIKLAELCSEALLTESISTAHVRRLAGLATWIAGVMPQMAAYTAMIWAAANASASGQVTRAQVTRPLTWLRALSQMNMAPDERHCRRTAQYFTLITFDGSLSGGGATLQVGLHSIEQAAAAPIVSYWNTTWTDNDLKLVRAIRGEPSGQARLEALTLLIAVATWTKLFGSMQGSLAILGDALGVLYDFAKLRAKDPILNEIARETALILAPTGHVLKAAHIWTQRNTICDALSRLRVNSHEVLAELKGATRVKPIRARGTLLRME